MTSLYDDNFCEIAIKSKIEYLPFKHYFYQSKDEFSLHNSFLISHDKFIISGFVLLKLFSDYSIKFTKITKNFNQTSESTYMVLTLDETNLNKLNELIEFYIILKQTDRIRHDSVQTEIKMEKINFQSLIIVQAVYNFYQKYESYFSEVDNYFKMNEIESKLGSSSFILLSRSMNEKGTKSHHEFLKLRQHVDIITQSINIGDEIISLSSNLGVISYDHFSKSYSKGIISNSITDNILSLDIRILPNSHGAIVYKKNHTNGNVRKYPCAIILPILNVKYSYTPIIFALKIKHLLKIIGDFYSSNYDKYDNLIKSECQSLDSLSYIELDSTSNQKINIFDSVFIVYNLTNYATCFYIGNGRFVTNKHFFSNETERIYVKNHKNNFECEIEFIPYNNMDLAIIRIKNYNLNKELYDKNLKSIKLAEYKPNILQPVVCVGFSYYNKREIINDKKYPNFSKGILSKIINKRGEYNKHMIYQVDCSCFSGGSGCPVVDENGYMIGVLFQNLSFNSNDNFLQLPNSGFLISKEIVEEILECLQKNEDLSKLWMFTLKNDEIDLYFNYRKMNPKF